MTLADVLAHKASLTTEQKENLRLLVQELRSGKYVQFKGALRGHDNRRCCLGVACEVYREKTGDGIWTNENSVRSHFKTSDSDSNSRVMPALVEKFFGGISGTFILLDKDFPDTGAFSAVSLNDFGCTFDEIADRIEYTYLS